MTKEEMLKRFKKIGIIHKEPITLRSGRSSDFYCDIKKTYGYPDIINALADEVERMLPAGITAVAASGYGGLPLASLVAAKSNKKFIAVRDKVKNHGKGGFIDGYVPNGEDHIVIIDDVLTTGGSIRETYEILKRAGGKISYAIVVVKRGDGKLPIPCEHLFTLEEIIKSG